MNAEVGLLSAIAKFAAEHRVRHALLTTFNFDGQCLEGEEYGLLDSICRDNCANVLVVRDRNQVSRERSGLRCRVVNAGHSTRVFHTKLAVLVANDAAFLAVGSANLTRGGLRTNLELVRNYELGVTGPKALFEDLHRYLDTGLRRELKGMKSPTGDYDELVCDLGELVGRAKPCEGPESRLLHNYDRPLYEQIMAFVGDRAAEQAWIVSPFYEDAVERHDPDDGDEDYAKLYEQLLKDLTFVDDSARVRTYFQAGLDGTTSVPITALKRHENRVELWKKNAQGIDPRRLHGKMLAFFLSGNGRRKPGAVIVYGSPNFTPSALLRTPDTGGNAELAVVTTFTGENRFAERLEMHYNLTELFGKVDDWSALKPAIRAKTPLPQHALTVREGHYRALDGEVDVVLGDIPANTTVLRAYLRNENGEEVLAGETSDLTVGAFTVKVPPEVARNVGSQYMRIGFNSVRVESLAADGTVIASTIAPVNIDCPGDGVNSYVKTGAGDDLDEEIYCYGLAGATSYQKMKDDVEKLEEDETVGKPGADNAPVPEHQADLDQFFRKVHIGLRGMVQRLEPRSSAVAFRDVLRMLGRWSGSTGSGEGHSTREQRLFRGICLLETAIEVRELMNKGGMSESDMASMVNTEFIARAEAMKGFGEELLATVPELHENATDLLSMWSRLAGKSGKRGRDGKRS